ncbi:MAG: SPOR domain-containing protein [Burkholderiaceae bacterium]
MNKSADEDDQFSLQTASPYRTKARQRLIGALALVVLLAIVMPIFFHAEPRIPSVDPRLEKSSDEALSDHKAQALGASVIEKEDIEGEHKPSGEDEAATKTAKLEAHSPSEASPTPVLSPTASEAKSAAQAKSDAQAKSETPQQSKASDKPDKAAKQPYPERYPDRYVLQAGAFSQSDNAEAQVARLKKLGLKVYTDRIKTPKGERVRVRVGPFDSKADALKAQSKLRQARLEASLAGPDA